MLVLAIIYTDNNSLQRTNEHGILSDTKSCHNNQAGLFRFQCRCNHSLNVERNGNRIIECVHMYREVYNKLKGYDHGFKNAWIPLTLYHTTNFWTWPN